MGDIFEDEKAILVHAESFLLVPEAADTDVHSSLVQSALSGVQQIESVIFSCIYGDNGVS